jgi:hypothetical protein
VSRSLFISITLGFSLRGAGKLAGNANDITTRCSARPNYEHESLQPATARMRRGATFARLDGVLC